MLRGGPFVLLSWLAAYFEEPEEPLEPEPMPLEPVLPAPEAPVLEPVLPALLGALDEPLDEEPEAPCSRRQRSFSEPVRLSHWMLLPTLGVLVEELPLALGVEVLEPVEPLVEESAGAALWLPPTLCPDEPDEVCAIEAAENAKSAARVEVQRILNIRCFSYGVVQGRGGVR